MPKAIDLTGLRFGRLEVVGLSHATKQYRYWACLCDCGKSAAATTASLRNGNKKSCGCLKSDRQREACTKHGLSNTPTWRCWYSMIQRCYHTNHMHYGNYGGRGIVVHERYRNTETGIVNLIADIGERPGPQWSLDRFPDNDGNYEPGNIRWATASQQQRNRSTNATVIFQGRVRLILELAEEYGLKYTTLKARIRRGHPIEEALAAPLSRDFRK